MTDETRPEERADAEEALQRHDDHDVVSDRGRWLQSAKRHAPKLLAAAICVAIGVAIGATFDGGADTSHDAHDVHHAHDAEAGEAVYTCSMHPQIRSDEPGQCPICGMDLIPLDHARAEDDAPAARVELTERAETLARVRTSVVQHADDERGSLHLLGRIEVDETRMRLVTAWTAGRIDRLHVAATGQKVRRGQTIATMYSPEIYAAHRDLLQAGRQLEQLAGGMEFARSSAQATLETARQKLRLLGVSDADIEKMEAAKTPWTQVSIRARFGGTVVEKLVDEGNWVEPGTGIYRVADLSHLWVQLDAYETDLPSVSIGQEVTITSPSLAGEELRGTVAFIDPVVDPVRRTAEVRVELRDRDGQLKPGMYVDAVVTAARPASGSSTVVIPDSAPLLSGRRALVYVEVSRDPPTYEAREVTLGPRAGDVYPVLAGLTPGERVVTHGAFAIDAELQIRGGASLLSRDDPPTHDVPPGVRTALEPVVRRYLDVQRHLADDDLAGASGAAQALHDLVHAMKPETWRAPDAVRDAWDPIGHELRAHALHVTDASTVAAAREGFEPLSLAVMRLLSEFGNPLDEPVNVAYCPMVFDDRGAEWVQLGETIDNSYYGDDMLTCGEFRESVAPGAHLRRRGTP